ncbi:MAG: D-2-hydroxyacid dehydrogenase [Actinomycetota bacterium]
MSVPARVVVMGATAEAPPPGIGVLSDVVDLAFADTEAELAAALASADVVFAWRPRSGLLEPVWEHAGDLRWLQASSAGVEDLLFPALVSSEVVVTNARGVFDGAMAEHVVAMLLLFARGIPATIEQQRARAWRPHDSERLEGRHLLVVGAGSVGRTIGRTCGALGMHVRGVATTARPGDAVFEAVLGSGDLLDGCAWADVVVDALPGGPGTRRVFDESAFDAMGPSTRFVNVGRGSSVDQGALVRALEEGRLGGAALDVFEVEPLPADSPLWGLPNVVVTPHASGGYGGWREAVVEVFLENLERYLTDRPLRNVVDKERGYVPS